MKVHFIIPMMESHLWNNITYQCRSNAWSPIRITVHLLKALSCYGKWIPGIWHNSDISRGWHPKTISRFGWYVSRHAERIPLGICIVEHFPRVLGIRKYIRIHISTRIEFRSISRSRRGHIRDVFAIVVFGLVWRVLYARLVGFVVLRPVLVLSGLRSEHFSALHEYVALALDELIICIWIWWGPECVALALGFHWRRWRTWLADPGLTVE